MEQRSILYLFNFIRLETKLNRNRLCKCPDPTTVTRCIGIPRFNGFHHHSENIPNILPKLFMGFPKLIEKILRLIQLKINSPDHPKEERENQKCHLTKNTSTIKTDIQPNHEKRKQACGKIIPEHPECVGAPDSGNRAPRGQCDSSTDKDRI